MSTRLFCSSLALALMAAAATAGDLPLREAPAEYLRRAALPATQRCAQDAPLLLAVDLKSEASQLDVSYDAASARLHILYRMNYNQLTEGWNWHPESAAAGGDYYTFKYLPLGTVPEERGRYRAEDKIGTPQEFAVRWRYDYFFAFDNPDDFYARDAGDDAGFRATVEVAAADAARLMQGDLRMHLEARLDTHCLSDSTTFWKATSARPEDFTLKKRYLIGQLVAVSFFDAASDRLLARLTRR